MGDDPPLRVAFFLDASHGDVDGFVYEPSGRVTDPAVCEPWLYGAHARPLFGPWYRFANGPRAGSEQPLSSAVPTPRRAPPP